MIHLENNLSHPSNVNVTADSLTFIIPAMNEEATLETLFQGIRAQAEKLTPSWEVIFIDDGSTDSTWNVMKTLARRESAHVRSLRFRHNRGKADALALGYREAKGDIVFTMDADLQDDPNEIPRFLEKLAEGFDIVSGFKKKRHDPWHKVLPSRVFNAAISKLVDVKLHDHNCGFKAYRREVVKSLPMYGDMHRMVPSLASFNGYKTGEIVVQHHPRLHGESKYGWGRIAIGLMDMTTVSFLKRFRDCPMHFAGKMAAALVGLGFLQLVVAVVLTFTLGGASLFVTTGVITALTGVLVVNQGLMMEHRVYERMQRPRTLPVDEEVSCQEAPSRNQLGISQLAS
ncbi:MAG: glycosyltransferase family 2 protein [Roseibacillus sp.]